MVIHHRGYTNTGSSVLDIGWFDDLARAGTWCLWWTLQIARSGEHRRAKFDLTGINTGGISTSTVAIGLKIILVS